MTVKVRIHAEGFIEQRTIRLLKIEASVGRLLNGVGTTYTAIIDITNLMMYHEGNMTRVIFDGSVQLESILDVTAIFMVLHDSTLNVLELTKFTVEALK